MHILSISLLCLVMEASYSFGVFLICFSFDCHRCLQIVLYHSNGNNVYFHCGFVLKQQLSLSSCLFFL